MWLVCMNRLKNSTTKRVNHPKASRKWKPSSPKNLKGKEQPKMRGSWPKKCSCNRWRLKWWRDSCTINPNLYKKRNWIWLESCRRSSQIYPESRKNWKVKLKSCKWKDYRLPEKTKNCRPVWESWAGISKKLLIAQTKARLSSHREYLNLRTHWNQ